MIPMYVKRIWGLSSSLYTVYWYRLWNHWHLEDEPLFFCFVLCQPTNKYLSSSTFCLFDHQLLHSDIIFVKFTQFILLMPSSIERTMTSICRYVFAFYTIVFLLSIHPSHYIVQLTDRLSVCYLKIDRIDRSSVCLLFEDLNRHFENTQIRSFT